MNIKNEFKLPSMTQSCEIEFHNVNIEVHKIIIYFVYLTFLLYTEYKNCKYRVTLLADPNLPRGPKDQISNY